MERPQSPLQGSCSCGRNQYTITVPKEGAGMGIGDNEGLSVWFESGREHRYHHANPLVTPFLRIPLPWYTSETYPLYPDETPPTIRRATASPSPHFTLRYFCGYCGTPLSLWQESPAREKDFISVTLGSLWGRDVRVLEEMGVLPESEGESSGEEEDVDFGTGAGKDWFGRMVEGSPLSRVVAKQPSSHHLPHYNRIIPSSKPRVTVEWEIMEWSSDDEDADTLETTTTTTTTRLQIHPTTTTSSTSAKRKIGEITTEGVASIMEIEMVGVGDDL